MTDSYSKTEADIKLALVEERLDHKFDRLEHKFDRVLFEIKEGFVNLDNKFTQQHLKMDNDIQWLKWISISFIAGSFILRLFGKS